MKDTYKAPCAEVKELEIESVCLDDSSKKEVHNDFGVEPGSIEDLSW